jgi:serine/threonine-protein kinase RsbW
MSNPIIISLDLPADHRYLNIASACIVALMERIDDVPDHDMVCYSIQLAVQETCANIVDHAYKDMPNGRISIEWTLMKTPPRLATDIYDTGRAFDPTLVHEPDLDNAQVRGYGLFLMNQLMDAVIYERQPDRNHWHLAKNLQQEVSRES